MQGRFRVLDCGAPGAGFGSLGLIARREEVLGSGSWLRGARRSWVLGSGCAVRKGSAGFGCTV